MLVEQRGEVENCSRKDVVVVLLVIQPYPTLNFFFVLFFFSFFLFVLSRTFIPRCVTRLPILPKKSDLKQPSCLLYLSHHFSSPVCIASTALLLAVFILSFYTLFETHTLDDMKEEIEAAARFLTQLVSQSNQPSNISEDQLQIFKRHLIKLFEERFHVSVWLDVIMLQWLS